MTTEKCKLEQDLCRCCHAEGTFRSLGMSCEEMGCEEICSDILRDCFNIDLTPIEGQSLTTYAICDECINRLGDAFNFKKQVMHCEERFQQMYGGGLIEDEVEIGPKTRSQLVKKQPLLFQDVTAKERSSDDEDPRPDDDDHPDGNGRQDGEIEEDCISMEPLEDEVIVCINEDTSMEKINEQRKRKPAPKKKSTKKAMVKKEKKPVQDPSKQSTNKQVADKPKTMAKNLEPSGNGYKVYENMFACAHCDRKYETLDAIRRHLKRIHYKTPRVCDVCNMSFMNLSPLTVHKLNEHGIDERIKCNACDSAFNCDAQLREHVSRYHKLGVMLKCEFCHYETIGSREMNRHKIKHTKTVRDHVCSFCQKTFLRRKTMKLHERIHTGDKKKVCRECGQAFVQKASLNQHMARHHPDVPL